MHKKFTFQLNDTQLFYIAFACLTFLIVGRAVIVGADMNENIANNIGNDSVMRLTVVRDLIAGQSWFDNTQYRIVPPEGLPLHWSRYIDAGIASFILLLNFFVEIEIAEHITVSAWPTLIFVLQLLVVGFGTRKVFGTGAAFFSILSMVMWPVTAAWYVRPGNLDHHNVQMLLMFILILALIWPKSSSRAALIAGLSAAFSLAVGLETIIFVVIAGLITVFRSAYSENHYSLIAFCSALFLGSVLFWIGQAPPATRLIPVCDQLGTPLLSLIFIASGASILPRVIIGRSGKPLEVLGFTFLLVVLGVLLIWPLLNPCKIGPYGTLPEEIQYIIKTKIMETVPAHIYAERDIYGFVTVFLPIIAAGFLGSLRWLQLRKQADFQSQAAVFTILVFFFSGLCITFYQLRAIVLVGTAVPILIGVCLNRIAGNYKKNHDTKHRLAFYSAFIVLLSPNLVAFSLQPVLGSRHEFKPIAQNCMNNASLKSLNDVPPGLILSNVNFGPKLIWATHHDALSAPYHRSAAAIGNGFFPLNMEEIDMKTHVLKTDADYLLLCGGGEFEGTFAAFLASGASVDWLERIELVDTNLILFTVKRK
jgi:hypothetical protein